MTASETRSTWKMVKELNDELDRVRAQSLENYRALKTLQELYLMAEERHGTGAELLIKAALSIAEQRARAKEVWIA